MPQLLPQTDVLILGGGLAGLAAADHLARAGIRFGLIEARDRLGGRVLTVDHTGRPAERGFDLGPSWFWPDLHPAMAKLVADLGLQAQPQAEGDMLFQRANGRVDRYAGLTGYPVSMRLHGGTATLISALAARLPPAALVLNHAAHSVRQTAEGIEVQAGDRTFTARHLILALPPRIAARDITLVPAPPPALLDLWERTPTWMAPHAKFLAVYDRPFWRDHGLSGSAQSQIGPLGEIHDASTVDGQAALFGFVGIPAAQRRDPARLQSAALAQLTQIFGPAASHPKAVLFKDWAADPLTATTRDQSAGGHPAGGPQTWVDGEWQDRLWLAGSETAEEAPGYLAGAIEAGHRAAAAVLTRLTSKA